MIAALGIIPVRDDDQVESEVGKNIYTFDPMQFLAHLVYFVYRQCEPANGQGGRAGRNKTAAAEQLGVSLKTLYNKLNQANALKESA